MDMLVSSNFGQISLFGCAVKEGLPKMESLSLIIEASAVRSSDLPLVSSLEPTIYDMDSSLEHGSSPNSPLHVVCETGVGLQNVIPGPRQNTACMPKNDAENVERERVGCPKNSQCSQSSANAGFLDTLRNVKYEVVPPSISTANVINDFMPNIIPNINERHHLGFPAQLNVHSETRQGIQGITSELEGSEAEDVPTYCDMKPLDHSVTKLTEYSVGSVDGEVFDVKQPIVPDLTASAKQENLDLPGHILDAPVSVNSVVSEAGLANSGHLYEDLKVSETGLANSGHVYEDLKVSETGLANSGHLYVDLKVSETGLAHAGHVYEDLKVSETGLAHAGHVYEDLKVSETGLAHAGHVYEDLKVSETGLANSGHVYEDLKPIVLEYLTAPVVDIERDSEISRQSPINLGYQSCQVDTKVEEHLSGSELRSPVGPVDQGSPGMTVNQNDEVAPQSTASTSNESIVALTACALSKPHHVRFATNQVQENHDLRRESGEVVEQFHEITTHNRQPETIMLGPAAILDLNSHEVEERVSKHNKSLRLKKFKKKSVEMNLACEWGECEEVSDDLNRFINHITAHIGAHLKDYAEKPDLMACRWRHCGYETQRGIRDILRHVYFHAFHVKLKCLGIQMIIDNNLHACRTDGSSRNLIPELPESLVCGWVHCGHVCENAEYFYRHVDMHADSAPLDSFKCFWEGCTVKVRNRTRLRDHLRSHTQEKVIACPTCGGLFSNRCKFSDHLRRQGPMDTLCFQCSHCNKKYTTERLLRDHMRVHVNHYKCPFCDMTCPNPSTLNSHIKYRHSDDKPYECEHCQHKTKSAGDLRRHMEVHNEKKMFNCEFPGCDYSHKTFHGVSYHYRLLHQTPKKYLCHMCPATFERGSNLTRHLKKAHRFKWPSGHSRFRYRQQEDGTMGLQMVRYESVELATHFLDKDGEHVHAGPRDGHSAGFNSVPAYQSDATDTPIVNESNKASSADTNKSADTPADVFLTEADLSYNLEMLGDVALHEPEFSRSAENTPVKSKRKSKRSGSSPAKSALFSDLPSPIHGSAFQPNVAVHHEASSKLVTLSSNLPTSPEKSYEQPSTLSENNKTPQKDVTPEVSPGSEARLHTNSTPWKVTLSKSPRKRGQTKGRSRVNKQSADTQSDNSPRKRQQSAGRVRAVNKQSVETPRDETASSAKQTSARSPRLKRRKRFS